MGFTPGDIAVITLATTDISAYCDKVSLSRKGKSDKHRLLGGNGVVSVVMDPENEITLEGLIHPTAAALFTAHQGAGAAAIAFEYGPQGGGSGALKRSGTCRVVDYDEDTDGEKAGTFKATLDVQGAITDATYT